jgi:hypothetical protein
LDLNLDSTSESYNNLHFKDNEKNLSNSAKKVNKFKNSKGEDILNYIGIIINDGQNILMRDSGFIWFDYDE